MQIPNYNDLSNPLNPANPLSPLNPLNPIYTDSGPSTTVQQAPKTPQQRHDENVIGGSLVLLFLLVLVGGGIWAGHADSKERKG